MVTLELGNLSVVARIFLSFVAAGAGRPPYRFGGAAGVRALPAASCAATKETIGGRKIETKRNACLVDLPLLEALACLRKMEKTRARKTV